MLELEVQVVGGRRTTPRWSVPPPPEVGAGEPLTLRSLLAHVVRGEVRAFRERQERRQLLQVLTEAEIAAGAERGKVEPGGRDLRQEVDEEAAVATALQAFEDGFYRVLVDGDEQQELDHPVALRSESRLTFLRLVPLAGG